MIQINQLECKINYKDLDLKEIISNKFKFDYKEIVSCQILKESLDARKVPCYKLSVALKLKDHKLETKLVKKNVNIVKYEKLQMPKIKCNQVLLDRPIVVGFGPSGMFAALALAQANLKPIIFERGQTVENRVVDVENFWNNGILNEESNVQYGEGGAGTFSDGKLTSRIKDIKVNYILDELIKHGANPEIAYMAHPHIGTDKLRQIVINIRNTIIELGGEFNFNSCVNDFVIQDEQITGVMVNGTVYNSTHVFLAIGHSAKDTYEKLQKANIHIENKEFAIGVRIEHTQKFINECQYKKAEDKTLLPQAEYRLVTNVDNVGVYTFCMCPGGYVVPASSANNRLVVNGMSYSKRDHQNANSAILVQINKNDFEDTTFGGLQYIDELEKQAYILGGSNYQAPVQNAVDYINNQVSANLLIEPTYQLGYKCVDLNNLFSEKVNKCLKQAIIDFDAKMPGFINGVITGVESRSSSAIRITRNSDMQSINTKGLYPIGEGAGYAGGIISSALDGVKAVYECIK